MSPSVTVPENDGRVVERSSDSEIATRISASGEHTVEAIRFHGDSVADRLAQTSEATRSAAAEHSDEVVARISASGAQAVEAIRYHGDLIADRLAQTSLATRSAAAEHSDEVVARISAKQMARKFIAGSNVAEALRAVHRMRARRLTFTIDLLGEATITEPEADHVQKQYLDLLHGLTREVNALPEEPLIDRDDRPDALQPGQRSG